MSTLPTAAAPFKKASLIDVYRMTTLVARIEAQEAVIRASEMGVLLARKAIQELKTEQQEIIASYGFPPNFPVGLIAQPGGNYEQGTFVNGVTGAAIPADPTPPAEAPDADVAPAPTV